MAVRVRVRLDKGAVTMRTNTDNSAILNRIGSEFENTFKQKTSSRAGGTYWRLTRQVSLGGGRPQLTVTVHPSRPKVIVPRSAKVLVFDKDGTTVFAHKVNHPGASPPVGIVRDVADSIDSGFPGIASAAT